MVTKSTSLHCLVMAQPCEFADYQLNYVHIEELKGQSESITKKTKCFKY